MADMRVPLLRLEVAGEAAMACYFLMANSNFNHPGPTLDTHSHPMAIVFELESPAVLASIRATLERALALEGNIARSARALMSIVDDKAKDVFIPESRDDSIHPTG